MLDTDVSQNFTQKFSRTLTDPSFPTAALRVLKLINVATDHTTT